MSSKKRKDKRVEKEYWEEVEVTDPVTGKKTRHKIKIIKYKTVDTQKPVGDKDIIEELYEQNVDDFTYD